MRCLFLLPLLLALTACGQGGPALRATEALAGLGTSVSSSGPVAPACGIAGAALGTPVGAAAGYTVHDTAPGSTGARTHHITGFADGCPRAVTAALVLFGDLATYESLHYLSRVGGTAATDVAYERIKAEVCDVPAGQPCGDRLPRLAENTVFLSLYPVFGGEAHTDLLLHAGEVAAVDG